MSYAETRPVSVAIAGSLAVHGLLFLMFALWIGLAPVTRFELPEVVPEPEVTLVFPEILTLPPQPEKPQENYIRTTQNTEAPEAPTKADFVSDKNTVAMAKATPAPGGNVPLPSMQGVDFATKELANRTFRDGETKNDSAPSPPKPMTPPPTVAPQPPAPPAPPPQPPPVEQMAKKEDAPMEKMLKEFEATLAMEPAPKPPPEPPKPEDRPPEVRKAEDPRETLPTMRTPDEMAPPRAIPMAEPVVNTPRPEKDAFQPETHRSNTKGTISNLGREDAVNAAATPVGRYMRQVTSAVEKKWHQFRLQRADAVEPGKMGLRFYVNKNGKVEDLEFLFKESNALMEDFTIEAILKADIPPIPKDLLPILNRERVEITYDIVIHP